MAPKLTDDEIIEALQTCAAEPIHIPGIVQPFGCLLAVNIETNIIGYASQNCAEYIGQEAETLLGQSAPEVLGREAWHGLCNAASRRGVASQNISAGDYPFEDRQCALRVHQSVDYYVIEIEPSSDVDLDQPEALKTLSYLMMQLQSCTTQEHMFDVSVELLQHLTGYDRVLVYRFDSEFNGEILAEAKQAPIDSMMGLRFPHWDIPEQARTMMTRIPLRFISDITQVPVPILAPPGSEPLDISLSELRGVSAVHMQYLENMGIAATMTLSVKTNDRLWGIISFHHRRPKIPAPAMREVLSSFVMIFNSKLETLHQGGALKRIEKLDKGFVGQADDAAHEIEEMLPAAAPLILDVMQAQGIASVTGGEVVGSGNLPAVEVLEALSELALASDDVIVIEALAERLPKHAGALNGVAGPLVVRLQPHRAICIFRDEIENQVAWAGNPGKTIESFGGRVRLSPRGFFSTYLEQAKGRCDAWSENDIYLIGHLRTLLHAAERQVMMAKLNRQQTLMIGELNHRVRNILAFVRSVSRQARRRYGSLNSYANAIENRIRALAAAHDLSGGRFTMPVSMHDLIKKEFEPFQSIAQVQTRIEGMNVFLRPEIAPIFSLVIHELTTNAAKYGALTEPNGTITILLDTDADKRGVLDHVVDGKHNAVTDGGSNRKGAGLKGQIAPIEIGFEYFLAHAVGVNCLLCRSD